MNQKEAKRQQIHTMQKQLASMEREIEQLYAQRKNLVLESEHLLMELLNETAVEPMQSEAYLSDLDQIMLTEAELPARAKVACQGVEGSYSNQAAEQFFADPEIHYYAYFDDVFQAVEDGSVDIDELKESLNEETKIIVYRQGAAVPILIQPEKPIGIESVEPENIVRRTLIEVRTILHDLGADACVRSFDEERAYTHAKEIIEIKTGASIEAVLN